MSINPLNDISQVYLEQVAFQEAKVDKMLPDHQRSAARNARYDNPDGALALGGGIQRARRAAHRERDQLNKDAKDIRRGRLGGPQFQGETGKERIAAVKKAKGIYNSYEPEGELVDEATPGRGGGSGSHPRKFMNNQGKPETKVIEPKRPISLSARRRAAGLPEPKNLDIDESENPNDGNLANNYPPYNKITRGDVIAGATGNDEMGGKKKKKKSVKEGFSNWRQDLSEVIGDIETKTERQIKEKDNIKNIVIINPKLGEAIEEIGGTILEMVEIEDIELIEKAESEQQQKLFGLALSVKRGETPRSEVSAEVLKIVDSMSEKEIRKFAKTKHEGIPKKVEEELQPTTPQQFAAQRQLAMAQKKLTAADQIALQKKKKDMQQAQEEFVSEEDYDTMKDSHLERGGMGARSSTSPAKSGSSKPETPEERKKRMETQRKTAQKALELVRQKYKGSLM